MKSVVGRYYSTLSGLADKDIPAAWKASRYVVGVPIRPIDIGEERQQRNFEQERRAVEMLRYLQQRKIVPYKANRRSNKKYF